MQPVGIGLCVDVGTLPRVVPCQCSSDSVAWRCIDDEEVVVLIGCTRIDSSSGVITEVNIRLVGSIPVEVTSEVDRCGIGVTGIGSTTSIVARTGSTIDGTLHFHGRIP